MQILIHSAFLTNMEELLILEIFFFHEMSADLSAVPVPAAAAVRWVRVIAPKTKWRATHLKTFIHSRRLIHSFHLMHSCRLIHSQLPPTPIRLCFLLVFLAQLIAMALTKSKSSPCVYCHRSSSPALCSSCIHSVFVCSSLSLFFFLVVNTETRRSSVNKSTR